MINRLNEDIKKSMVSKDVVTKNILKMVKSKALMIAKEAKSEVTDAIVLDAFNKEMKQLNQTKELVIEGNSLYAETVVKIGIITSYLPKQMSEDEVKKVISDTLEFEDDLNVGMRMKLVMPKLKGKADSKMISELVKNYTK